MVWSTQLQFDEIAKPFRQDKVDAESTLCSAVAFYKTNLSLRTNCSRRNPREVNSFVVKSVLYTSWGLEVRGKANAN